jgi:hypothetical protein
MSRGRPATPQAPDFESIIIIPLYCAFTVLMCVCSCVATRVVSHPDSRMIEGSVNCAVTVLEGLNEGVSKPQSPLTSQPAHPAWPGHARSCTYSSSELELGYKNVQRATAHSRRRAGRDLVGVPAVCVARHGEERALPASSVWRCCHASDGWAHSRAGIAEHPG